MQNLIEALPSFSTRGKARLLGMKGQMLVSREFAEGLIGTVYQIGSVLYEVFTGPIGEAVAVAPVRPAHLDYYLDNIDISDVFSRD